MKTRRHAMLGKLFIEAQERGMTTDFVRDVVAPNLIHKRLSAASEKEISQVLLHICGPKRPSASSADKKKYASSMAGLREEIKDLAKARWPDTWSSSLNNLCRKFGVDHHNFLDMSHAKAVKQRLINWNREGAEGAKKDEVPF